MVPMGAAPATPGRSAAVATSRGHVILMSTPSLSIQEAAARAEGDEPARAARLRIESIREVDARGTRAQAVAPHEQGHPHVAAQVAQGGARPLRPGVAAFGKSRHGE